MIKLREDKERQPVPFLIMFTKPLPTAEKNYLYDEEMSLNMAEQDGQRIPAVLLPDSVARLKTRVMSEGASED